MIKIFQPICGYIFSVRQLPLWLSPCFNNFSEISNSFARNFSKLNDFTRTFSRMEKQSDTEKQLTIATHDGIFHCDEILACFMLQQLPLYKTAKILRTRDESRISSCDIVVDVGSVFDREKNRFDHHQKSFEHTLSTLRPEFGSQWTIRLSSAGLIYTYFGEQVIHQILSQHNLDLSAADEKKIYLKVYEGLIQEIDAIDNGVPMFAGEPFYRTHTCLSSRVSHFNSDWNSDLTQYDAQQHFEMAKEMVGREFLDKVLYFAQRWWPARQLVQTAVENRFAVHESGQILELATPCPWKDHLNEIEGEMNIVGIPKYVLFENKPGDNRVMCVPNVPKSFVCRKFLHKDYRGIRNDQLVSVSGIADASFCHATGFIGGAKSRDGALQMAIKSLEAPEED